MVQKAYVGGGDPVMREYEAGPGKNWGRGSEYEKCDKYEEPEAFWAN